MDDRFTWGVGDFILTDEIPVEAQNALNGRGYNPNRDTRTGRFTFGSGPSVASKYLHNGVLPNYNMKAPEGHVILYTNTKSENVNSIMNEGIRTGLNSEGYRASPEEGNMVWTDTRSPESMAYGGNTIAFKVPVAEANANKVNNTQHAIPRDIPADDILFVDRVLKADSGVKVSSLPEYAEKYGVERTAEVISRTGSGVSKDDVIALIGLYESRIENAYNARGYNPYRDTKTGRFTFGAGADKSGVDRETINALKEEAVKHDTVDDFIETVSFTRPVLFHGGDPDGRVGDNSFFGDFYNHAKEYASGYEDDAGVVTGILYDYSDVVYFANNENTRALREQYVDMPEPQLKKIYGTQIEDGTFFTAMDSFQVSEEQVLPLVRQYLAGDDIEISNDFLIPLYQDFAKKEGKNIVSFEGYDFGGSTEYVVADISKQLNLNELYKEVHSKGSANSLDDKVDNRGYNPNRDQKTGRFTYGPSSIKAEKSAGASTDIGDSGKIRLFASGGPGAGKLRVTDNSVQYGVGEGYMEFDATPLERSLYEDHDLKLVLGTPNTDKNLKKYNGYYLPSTRTLNLNVAKATDNPGRFEKTYYHEIGHAVDHMKSDFKHDSHSKQLFNGRSKTNPYVITKEAVAKERVYESLKSIYKIPADKMPTLTDQEYDKLTKANDFMMIRTPGHVNPNGQEYIVPYFAKSQISYYRSPSEVFAETYAISRIEPDKLESISDTVASDFKEYQQ